MKNIIRNLLGLAGLEIRRRKSQAENSIEAALPDFSGQDRAIIARVRPFTMTSLERLAASMEAVRYIVDHSIPGDIAECGVWRGGSMMAIALTLMARGDTGRSLYLYDTYEGMSAPTGHDKSLDGVPAEIQLNGQPRNTGIWCYADMADVRANVLSTGYPADKVHFVKGTVESTIPQVMPGLLALLRLDTDWYESTKHELIHLFPRLHARGVLIIDDYGHWEGAKKAVDEYFHMINRAVYLHRIDYTGRIMVGDGTPPPAAS